MIVDTHTHWSGDDRQRDGDDPSPWLSTFESYGVTHMVVLPTRGLMDAGDIDRDNEDIARVCAHSGGRMLPFCTANVWHADSAAATIEHCLDKLGHRGVKFHPWLQGSSVSSPGMDAVCEVAAAYDAPILLHDGTPPFSLPSQIAMLAKRHPRTTLILGHCGLLEHWREAIAALNACDNLWGCLCSPHLAAMREVIRRCDLQRLLWGSDQGFGGCDLLRYRFPLFDRLGLSDTQRTMILANNPSLLLHL